MKSVIFSLWSSQNGKIANPNDFPWIQAPGSKALDLDPSLYPGACIQGKMESAIFLFWSSQN